MIRKKSVLFTFLLACLLVSCKTQDVVTLYVAPDFKGKAISLSPGDYTSGQLKKKGLGDNSIASMKVDSGFQIIVYSEDAFQGNSEVFTGGINGDVSGLYNPEINADLTGKISSVRIYKPVIEDPEMRDKKAEQEALDGWWTESMAGKDGRIQWWRDAKFGCFMHWGVYSVLVGLWNGKSSGTYSEHIMRQAKIPLQIYKEVAVKKFNPAEFDADEWIRLLKEAGMKYLVITAKHHDGFAVYRSDAYYYDLDLTPFDRDPMMELRQACTKYGLKFGFYYSQAFDWEHPDGAGNDWEYSNPGGDRELWGGKSWFDKHPDLLARTARYYTDRKAIPQLVELIRKYHPDILWGDTDSKLPLSEKLRMLRTVRETDRNIVINGRFCRGGKTRNFGDYTNTADRPAELTSNEGDWEAIPTTNESYGFKPDDKSYKPVSYYLQLIPKAAARGGNILLNVGPRPDGKIDDPDMAILKGIGKWMKVNGESIYGTERTPLDVQSWGESTRKGNILYLHVFNWPEDGKLIVGGLKNELNRAWLLADPEKKILKSMRLNSNDILIEVPSRPENSANTVVVTEVSGNIETYRGRLLNTKTDNILRAFDAEKSEKLGYGDGKTNRDYIQGWKLPDQIVKWKIRANQEATYRLLLKYTTENQTIDGNSYKIIIGDKVFEKTVVPSAVPAMADFGEVSIPAGEFDLTIVPVRIKEGELMKLYNVTLAHIVKEKNL